MAVYFGHDLNRHDIRDVEITSESNNDRVRGGSCANRRSHTDERSERSSTNMNRSDIEDGWKSVGYYNIRRR